MQTKTNQSDMTLLRSTGDGDNGYEDEKDDNQNDDDDKNSSNDDDSDKDDQMTRITTTRMVATKNTENVIKGAIS